MQSSQTITVLVIWRGNKYVLEMDYSASLKELGHGLQKLTNVIEDTMRLIVPRNKGSNLYSPFSDDHSSLSLQQVSVIEGKPIKMMGVTKLEIDKVLQNEKADLRILGFDEEERRLRQRILDKPNTSLKLPQGQYTFCDFRTLELPGVELNPPPSEALKRMHMLAADPGIVAIMNKHHWRVGIMTEMAPVGYVGVCPKCILGLNKNHGEEISLRLRTDDLKGFRKYESIKKTLLHELAHMVYSEHDADFYSLDKQLNQEAATLDWSRSRGHTLSGVSHSHRYEENFRVEDTTKYSQKLGGDVSDKLASARASSVAAAYRRLANASANNNMELSQVNEEPDPDDSDRLDCVDKGNTNVETPRKNEFEPDPDDSEAEQKHLGCTNITMCENGYSPVTVIKGQEGNLNRSRKEPDHDDLKDVEKLEPISLDNRNFTTPESGHSLVNLVPEHEGNLGKSCKEPDPDESQANKIVKEEPDPDDDSVDPQSMKIDEPDPDDDSVDPQSMKIDESDPDNQELRRIQVPVTVFYSRLLKAIEMLKAEVNSSETTVVFQTLFKIIRNVIEHPNEMKYKRLRKANPFIQKNVANYKAAMEILVLTGFNEDTVLDETGKSETYLVLKRNDPGLLWLTKSSLEPCIA